MAFRTVNFIVLVEDRRSFSKVADYALRLCETNSAHLNIQIGVPPLDLPTGRILPLVGAMVAEENAEIFVCAKSLCDQIEASAKRAGVHSSSELVQIPYLEIRSGFIRAARLSDLILVPRPSGSLSSDQDLVEALLFGTGRPVMVVPSEWERGPAFERIVIAWDGGQRAARAVGDALPLLAGAREVEIVQILSKAQDGRMGAALNEHLARHCHQVRLTTLPVQFDDVGMTLRDHLSTVVPDLLVMGAYAHTRLLELVLGGVTNTMLSGAPLPVLYSY